MVAKGNCRSLACTPVRAKPARAGDPVIARDDSGARGWIEEIGKIETGRESIRDSTLNVKCGQLLFTQWSIRTIVRGSPARVRIILGGVMPLDSLLLSFRSGNLGVT